MITVQGVSKLTGKKDLFQDVSFHIHAGERVGLIGPNGAGKTTLFRIILGDAEPDAGSVMRTKNLRMGYLPQQWMISEDKTVLAHAMDTDRQIQSIRVELEALQQDLEAEQDASRSESLAHRQTQLLEHMERLGGYDLEARACKVLAGLGFRENRLQSPVSVLSGGWVMRLELARLLLSEPDILLLDEPTNHLDLESLLWLEQYLLASPSAMIVISHDRMFLNRIVRRMFELEHGRFQEYTGNYDDYLEEKAQRREIQAASYKNQQDRIRQVERFIERNRYRKSKARQVQSRLKMLDRVEQVELAEGGEESIHFKFPEPQRSGKRVIELENVHKAYGDHVVYSGVDLVVERGDRIAFMGPNGAGKSTLLKILAGVEDADAGGRLPGHQVLLGYYAQYQWDQLRPEWTVFQEVASVAGDMSQTQLRAMLGAFLFRGDDVLKKVAALSGGEKARLLLCKLMLQKPNLLLLDEPTNHLDIPSRDVLERALNSFTGSVCFISHDRHFINAIANKVLVAGAGRIHLFPGNFDDFDNIWRKRLEEEAASAGSPAGQPRDGGGDAKPAAGGGGGTAARKDQQRKRREAQWRNELHAMKKPLQKEVESLEADVDKLQRELDALSAVIADPETYRNGTRVRDLQREYQERRRRLQRLTEEWEEKALALDEMEENFRREKEKGETA